MSLRASIFIALALLAQQAQQPPVFRTDVQVVEVDARVFDRAGRFVTTLTRDDFEILEDGVPQTIVAMTLVGAPGTAAPGAPETVAPLPRLDRPTTDNRQPATGSRQTWIFFFDLPHLTPGGGFDRARKAVEEFIDTRFREGDLAGVIAGDKMVNNRLTSVRAELLQAVRSVKPLTDKRSRDVELRREIPRFRDEQEAMEVARENREVIQRVFQRACEDGECAPFVVEQIREKGRRFAREAQTAAITTLNTVNGLASGLAKIPGPKTIVFLSDGFVADTQEATLRTIVGQTARAGARVYAIDARGLGRGMNSASIDAVGAPGSDSAPPAFDALEDGVNSLAVDTGGMMIRNENNIGRALDTIAADTNTYYVLGYQPVNTSFDGKYRKIEIRVKRDGLRVRARQGYLALEPSKMLIPQPIKPPGDGPQH
jgi:VWFA-related protein